MGKPAPKGNTYSVGRGRPAGSPNKVNKELRELIMGALSDVGGQAYLAQQAIENPAPFLALLAKTLPKDVTVQGSLTFKEELSIDQLRDRAIQLGRQLVALGVLSSPKAIGASCLPPTD